MAEPFIGEIKIVAFNFAPKYWAKCDGDIVPIKQNPTLFALLGDSFGGDGRNDFALPDFRGRAPLGADYSPAMTLGVFGGLETVTLSESQMPIHSHDVNASTAEGDTKSFAGAVFSTSVDGKQGSKAPTYSLARKLVPLNDGTCTSKGGGQAHNNMQPSLVMNFCIALDGVFPPRD